MAKIKHILITSEANAFPKLVKWCSEHEISLVCQPFIQIEPIKNLAIPQTDWIFFNSPKGAKAYLENYRIYASKIGVLGLGTAKMVKLFCSTIDFCGDSSRSIPEIGEDFNSQLLPHETVFFPISDRSKKSIAKHISSRRKFELVTYQTNLNPIKFSQDFDLLIFTSPSNFLSYREANELTPNQIYVAFGKTTKASMANLKKVEVLKAPNEHAVIEFLENQFGCFN
ncbi:MAG: uroporphyrinogen-III synthase [Crocinitomix sp.]|nr:uroporphyrinogen-III synthase [Crocinitomix sp.]